MRVTAAPRKYPEELRDWIAAQIRDKDLTVLVNRYFRPLEALAATLSRGLGLRAWAPRSEREPTPYVPATPPVSM